ncbi:MULTISPECIES: hypothetical protein [Halobacteriovorax]|uniref:BFD-like [2Fe-2S]-binding domain-containing protein n=1 Tax=Halobacteriovorax vibrionivorans TaxID=2152716 RepID=A0ABY0IJF6_9BACT|nr:MULTISPECIES: hypothetical protein [Halobacteriovorax]AYF43782.1 Mercuric transport protein MerT [Halobacteriovorax sp. BALOs_7]RZF21684.1 hypothetical protein DAY19_08320 [Halobacteriovorax vibrionivorans]TGD49023.1 hypothetical protein EP118_00720 [Halobacteriovorax sp. Y22]
MSNCCSNNNDEKSKEVDLENLDGLICYCFKKSKKELFEAVRCNNQTLIVDEIKAKMKDPGCFCERANPSGKCCLADVMAFIKAASKN